jgi:ketosteroid isomerase-like protein
MSQENMNVARRIADGFEAQDFDAVRRNFDSNIEWYEDPSFPEAGVYRGIDAVAEYARQFRSEFAELRYEVVELLEANAHVIARMKVAWKGKVERGGLFPRRMVGLRVQGRQGDPLLLVSSPKRSPRSRRAAGVGALAPLHSA